MRKNTARHWLHAVLDLLPVILIPVFMIYSHRHVLTERTEVDIQYKYQSNEVNSVDDVIQFNVYTFKSNNLNIGDMLNTYEWVSGYILNDLQLTPFARVDETFSIYSITPNTFIQIYNNDGTYTISTYFDFNQYEGGDPNVSYIYQNTFSNDLILQVYDFDANYTLFEYTDYNEIESVDVQDTNCSIMNVFMDDFNYSVNKYFNMGNVFNLKDVYHWFEVNIFNNNPPVVMASIYNIIVYEFVMDLLFLLYGLFMWFVDMLKRLIEKPIDSIK